jgi:hypothetical protein
MAKHLKFDILWADYNNINQGHPKQVMKKLGITYQHATPKSIGEVWLFWNCENIPEILPPFLESVDIDPIKFIGYGLYKEDAEKIRDYKAV